MALAVEMAQSGWIMRCLLSLACDQLTINWETKNETLFTSEYSTHDYSVQLNQWRPENLTTTINKSLFIFRGDSKCAFKHA